VKPKFFERGNLTPVPSPSRFRLRFSHVRLDAAREIAAEKGGRTPQASALTNSQGPREASEPQLTHPKNRVSATPLEIPRAPHSPRSLLKFATNCGCPPLGGFHHHFYTYRHFL